VLDPCCDVGDLARRCGAVRCRAARQELARILHHRDPRWYVSDARAVVDQRSAFTSGVPAIDVVRADLELEGRRHAVHRFQRVDDRVDGALRVLMQIDEARSDDEARRVNERATAQALGGNGADDAAADAHVAYGVEPRLGIDDAAVRDDDVVRLDRLKRRGIRDADDGQDGDHRRGALHIHLNPVEMP
jgi:hypothetical protein